MSSVNILEEVSNLDKRLNMGKFEEPLNSKGKEGWELVSATELRIEGDQVAGNLVKKVAFRKRDCRFLCIWKRPRVHSGKLSAEELEKLR